MRVCYFMFVMVLLFGVIGCDDGDDGNDAGRRFDVIIQIQYINDHSSFLISTGGKRYQLKSDTLVFLERDSCSGYEPVEPRGVMPQGYVGNIARVYYYLSDVNFGANPPIYPLNEMWLYRGKCPAPAITEIPDDDDGNIISTNTPCGDWCPFED